MKKYTVIGLHEETGQIFAFQVKAEDEAAAMCKVAEENLHGNAEGITYFSPFS